MKKGEGAMRYVCFLKELHLGLKSSEGSTHLNPFKELDGYTVKVVDILPLLLTSMES